jgi:hypothetical protein
MQNFEMDWVFLYLFFQSGKLFTYGIEVGICEIFLLDDMFGICEDFLSR